MDFSEYANTIHKDIRLELRWSREEIVFLDTVVKMDQGRIYTDLHIKPTDNQLYLQQTSCHPANTKKSLAFSLKLRIKRICEKEEDYKRHRTDLKVQLRKRGYSHRTIEQQLRRVDDMDRKDFLNNETNKSKNDRVPLVITYSKNLPDVRAILRKHQETLYMSDRMREVFADPPLLAFRRDINICDSLVHGKTNRALRPTPNPCMCVCCQKIIRSDIKDTADSKSYKVQKDVDYNTTNLLLFALWQI